MLENMRNSRVVREGTAIGRRRTEVMYPADARVVWCDPNSRTVVYITWHERGCTARSTTDIYPSTNEFDSATYSTRRPTEGNRDHPST